MTPQRPPHLRPARRLFAIAPALLLCIVAAAAARGAGQAGSQAADFPPGEFTDGGRYSLADLKGKAIVLYFYEKG